jgi:hypothetical protein
MAQRSLSSSGSAEEASRQVFDALRWTESVKGAEAVIFPLLSEFVGDSGAAIPSLITSQPISRTISSSDELLFAVEDRLFRAASGVVVMIGQS